MLNTSIEQYRNMQKHSKQLHNILIYHQSQMYPNHDLNNWVVHHNSIIDILI